MEFKTEMLMNSLLATDSANLGFFDLLLSLILPLLLSFVVTKVYMKVQKTNNYNKNFIISLFIFATLTSVITMIIGGNLARAFGLIGALSIIRFRNALKDTMDAIFIFWALSVGMASGAGFFLAAIVLTIVIAIFVLVINKSSYGDNSGVFSLIKIKLSQENLKNKELIKRLNQEVSSLKGVKRENIIFNSSEEFGFLVYSCKIKDVSQLATVCEKIKGNESVEDVHYLNNEFFQFIDNK